MEFDFEDERSLVRDAAENESDAEREPSADRVANDNEYSADAVGVPVDERA